MKERKERSEVERGKKKSFVGGLFLFDVDHEAALDRLRHRFQLGLQDF